MPEYPIADTILSALAIDPERVQAISYWANALDASEGGNVTLSDQAVADAKSALNRYPIKDIAYRASPQTHRCSTCSFWDGTGDGVGTCSSLTTTAPFAAQVVTPSEMHCTLYSASEPSRHGGYVSADECAETDQRPAMDNAEETS